MAKSTSKATTKDAATPVVLDVDGTSYTLSYSVDAIIEAEEVTGRPYGAMVSDLAQLSVSTMRALLKAGLQAHHGKIPDATAIRILEVIGVARMTNEIVRALQQSPLRAMAQLPRMKA